MTSPSLRDAMDETGLSRTDIIDAAQRLINDHGQENVAAAKRLELILDDMLTNGYETMDGRSVEANAAYLKAKQGIPGYAEAEQGGDRVGREREQPERAQERGDPPGQRDEVSGEEPPEPPGQVRVPVGERVQRRGPDRRGWPRG